MTDTPTTTITGPDVADELAERVTGVPDAITKARNELLARERELEDKLDREIEVKKNAQVQINAARAELVVVRRALGGFTKRTRK